MSEPHFIGDLHISNNSIKRFRPIILDRYGNSIDWSSQAEYNETLIDNIVASTGKRDDIYFMGDICDDVELLKLFTRISGRKFLILGNHDTLNVKEYIPYFHDIFGITKYKNMWLSHCPIHPNELFCKVNIHGHTHRNFMPSNMRASIDDETIYPDTRYINVSADVVDFKPYPLTLIKQRVSIHE